MARMLSGLIVLIGCTGCLIGADPGGRPAFDGPRYYILLFGGQADWRPQTAHTWATFVEARRLPNGLTTIDSFTISWLPIQMPVRPLKLQPLPGRNYGLHETLDIMWGSRPILSLWGPWEISSCWYHEACNHKAYLDSGAVRFRTLDFSIRAGDLSHCVHAVTNTNATLAETADPITWYGELVTRRVANAMVDAKLIAQPHVTHDWLLPALTIETYPLTRRRIGEPILRFARGPVVWPLRSLADMSGDITSSPGRRLR